MKRKLLLCLSLAIGSLSFAQFTTGVVNLAGSTRTIKIDTNPTTVTMTLTGNSARWLGVGFGGGSMATSTDMFIWNATANRDYTPSGAQSGPSADAAGSQSWTISSDTVLGAIRTVVATRPLVSTGDYTFLNDNSSITIIFAEGSTTTLGYHGNNPHSSQTLTRTQLGVEDFSLRSASIFPNPSKGDFSVRTKTFLTKINIYNQTGAFVKTIDIKDASDNVEVSVKGLETGVYLIELVNDLEKSWKKVIVN
jgi:hypothetical protein